MFTPKGCKIQLNFLIGGAMDPIPGWLRRLWDAWDIRVLALISLGIQIILIILGSRRKVQPAIGIEAFVWFGYLSADAVVLFTLGKISDTITNTTSSDGDTALLVLWAPILLLHLGGPDTITAYSIEDTQLWLRQLGTLLSHIVLVVYILMWSWTRTWLSYFTIFMFVAGIIKYGERTWVLWNASNDDAQERESIEGHAVALDLIRDIDGVKMIVVSYFWLQTLAPYLANYGGQYEESERVALMSKDFERHEIFKLIEFVLSFMFDVLYTKAPLIHSKKGAGLRAVSFFSTVTVLLSFIIFDKAGYTNANIAITYVLLVGAVVLEVYAATNAMYSDWGILMMIKYCRRDFAAKLVQRLAPKAYRKWKRWSNSIAQTNLLEYAVYKEKSQIFIFLGKVLKVLPFGLDKRLERYGRQSKCQIKVAKLDDVKERILNGVDIFTENLWEFDTFRFRGEMTLERYQCIRELGWMTEKDLDQCIIAWHIATEICYKNDKGSEDDQVKMTSLHLSRYMMYLLINHPYMLRVRADNEMLEKTSSHLKERLPGDKKYEELDDEDWKRLKQKEDDDESLAKQRWPLPKSALVFARVLAAQLIREEKINIKRRWEIISIMWVELLCNAASQCQVNYHAKQLTRGGELLTHVWLLLTMHGLTEKAGSGGSTLRKIFMGQSTEEMEDWA